MIAKSDMGGSIKSWCFGRFANARSRSFPLTLTKLLSFLKPAANNDSNRNCSCCEATFAGIYSLTSSSNFQRKFGRMKSPKDNTASDSDALSEFLNCRYVCTIKICGRIRREVDSGNVKGPICQPFANGYLLKTFTIR